MNDLQKLKEVIQKANPEIMELKFGCEVEVKTYSGNVTKVIYLDEGGSGVYVSHPSLKSKTAFFEKFDYSIAGFKKYILKEILGRPIRLADVLLAIKADVYIDSDGFFLIMLDDNDVRKVGAKWNLQKNNLDDQSPETIKFLLDLLCKE